MNQLPGGLAAGLPIRPAPLQQPGGAPVGLRPYQAHYQDASKDPYASTYAQVYANFTATQVIAPSIVRDKLLAGNASGIPMGQIMLVRNAGAAANDPGTVRGYHRLTKYLPSLARATPFVDINYAFMGDVAADNQAPASIIFTSNYNHLLTGVTQVPTPAHLDQLLAADPNATMVGPFAAGDADTEAVNTRFAMYVPNKYFAMLMGPGMSPRDAWARVRGSVVNDGLDVDCEELVNWLRVALTRPADAAPSRSARAPPATQALAMEEESELFSTFRMKILFQDHPQLRAGAFQQGFNQVAQGLTNMVDLQCQNRLDDDARRIREKSKTSTDLFPLDLHRVMRWCQVAHEADLPPLVHQGSQLKEGETPSAPSG